ncbi:hypothetical protein RB619_08700 [Flavobacterium sp. LHD-80]|uniref:hypothetical protein n=1 Tax=Flavobacterium sp. LHD-80 TaxID=3071411 RepID=UPI0027E06B8C|nr:hypothetical protein [Flavobacterium sp. LHD-80]MDQ6470717.1 hypothetical protein [Flavobacterium sp. LHD-80]
MSIAISLFQDREGYALRMFASKEDKEKSKKEEKEIELKKCFLDFEGSERREVQVQFRVRLSKTSWTKHIQWLLV